MNENSTPTRQRLLYLAMKFWHSAESPSHDEMNQLFDDLINRRLTKLEATLKKLEEEDK
jgi:hypothetical protein